MLHLSPEYSKILKGEIRIMIDKIAGYVRRCVDDYNMVEQGETIAVGVSGGKDSMVLLCALASLARYHPKQFKVHAVTLDMGFEANMDGLAEQGDSPVALSSIGEDRGSGLSPCSEKLSPFNPIKELCDELGVPFTLKRSEIASVVFEHRKEKNPCSLCATMRRAALCNMVKELGINKIALAHHYDDAIETFMLSLLYEGRISCFQPVTYLDRTEVTQIRPMIYVEEKTIINYVKAENIQIVKNPCTMNGVSKREEVKTLLKTLGIEHRDIKSKIFGAIQRLPIKGW